MPGSVGQVEWLTEETSAGCVERSFLMRRLPGAVPGVLWLPKSTAPEATVLLFHGGSGHRRTERHLRMGRRLTSAGLAVVAIDGPHHGDRVPAPLMPSVYQQRIVDQGVEAVTARMTADWQWNDELFPRDGQFELFDALGSADKQLIARPGPHGQTHPDDEAAWLDFLTFRSGEMTPIV